MFKRERLEPAGLRLRAFFASAVRHRLHHNTRNTRFRSDLARTLVSVLSVYAIGIVTDAVELRYT